MSIKTSDLYPSSYNVDIQRINPMSAVCESHLPHPVLVDDVVERKLRELPVQLQEFAFGHPSAVEILLRLEDKPIRMVRVPSDTVSNEYGVLSILQTLLPYPVHPGIVQFDIRMRHRCPVMTVDIEPEPVRLEEKIRGHRHIPISLLPFLSGLNVPDRGAEAAQELPHVYLEIYSQTYCVIRIVIHA